MLPSEKAAKENSHITPYTNERKIKEKVCKQDVQFHLH